MPARGPPEPTTAEPDRLMTAFGVLAVAAPVLLVAVLGVPALLKYRPVDPSTALLIGGGLVPQLLAGHPADRP